MTHSIQNTTLCHVRKTMHLEGSVWYSVYGLVSLANFGQVKKWDWIEIAVLHDRLLIWEGMINCSRRKNTIRIFRTDSSRKQIQKDLHARPYSKYHRSKSIWAILGLQSCRSERIVKLLSILELLKRKINDENDELSHHNLEDRRVTLWCTQFGLENMAVPAIKVCGHIWCIRNLGNFVVSG